MEAKLFRNYLTVAVRALFRHPGYSLINILGLSVGIVVCMLVGLYVRLEFSFDDFHPKGERVYKLIRETRREDGGVDFNRGIQGPLPVAIAEDFAQVESAIRTRPRWTYFRYGEKILEPNFMVVDPGFLEAFAFPLLRGETKSLSSTSNAVLMTESMARRFFGNTDPIGKVIHTDYKYFVGRLRRRRHHRRPPRE